LATLGVWFFTLPARAKLPCTCHQDSGFSPWLPGVSQNGIYMDLW
jgi:hypothetical protein